MPLLLMENLQLKTSQILVNPFSVKKTAGLADRELTVRSRGYPDVGFAHGVVQMFFCQITSCILSQAILITF